MLSVLNNILIKSELALYFCWKTLVKREFVHSRFKVGYGSAPVIHKTDPRIHNTAKLNGLFFHNSTWFHCPKFNYNPRLNKFYLLILKSCY